MLSTVRILFSRYKVEIIILIGVLLCFLILYLLWGRLRHPQVSNQDISPPQIYSCVQPNAKSTNESPEYKEFQQVQNVPSGLFSYGGSTTWAQIREKVDPEIEKAWPNFRLKYNDPKNELPGSDTGIKMLLNNELTFSQSSRELKPEEQQKGLEQREVAIDGIAFAVNPDLKIDRLTIDQLRAIYTGKKTNWSQLGGPNIQIVPYSRRSEKGGTPDYFISHVLCESLGANVKLAEETTPALRQVIKEQGSIYYASASEVVNQCEVRPLQIAKNDIDGYESPYITPWADRDQCRNNPRDHNESNTEAFENGKYPLTRTLYVIFKKDENNRKAGEAYANLLRTEEGQQLLKKAGFGRIEKEIKQCGILELWKCKF